MIYFFLFVIGLCFGSFINVISIRYEPSKPLFRKEIFLGRSHCPYCQKKLSWFELIPLISFFIQKGRCRTCHHRLSWQYPSVELASGLIFLFIPLYFSSFFLFPASLFLLPIIIAIWLAVFLLLLLISLIDLKHYMIPDELIYLLAFLGLGVILFNFQLSTSNFQLFNSSFLRHYALVFTFSENILLNHLFGILIAGTFFGLLVLLSKGKIMGFGDFKLSLALGLLLGWPDIGLALILSFVIGGAVGIFMIISHKKTRKDYLPFAPFLCLGVFLTVFFGYQLINSYFSLFGL